MKQIQLILEKCTTIIQIKKLAQEQIWVQSHRKIVTVRWLEILI